MKQVLFLCSANYYRSRFAEHLFNWLATRRGLKWRADSRGLAVGQWAIIGPISEYAVSALDTLGIELTAEHREPRQLTETDLSQSHLVIAVKESEHRPMMADQFPVWQDSVEYWHVHDLDCAEPDVALPALELQVRDLVDRLAVSS